MSGWLDSSVLPDSTIRETIRKIDASSLQIALVVDNEKYLLGTVTDGDIRRGLLRGVRLDDPIVQVMNANPATGNPCDDNQVLIAAMRSQQIQHLPLVDATGRVVGLESLSRLLSPVKRSNPVVLMAGGQGSRLRPLTENCPKPMLAIGNRPLLETILLNFVDSGFQNFFIAVNHLAEKVIEYFEDGAKWNIKIEYLRESQKMGTAGALSLLPSRPAEPVLVMNGDLLTKVNPGHLLDFHLQERPMGTMCVRQYEIQIPYGVVTVNGQQIVEVQEKPTHRFFVNAGIYVLEPTAIALVPSEQPFQMTDLFGALAAKRYRTTVFPLREYWLDVGQPSDFSKAESDFERVFSGDQSAIVPGKRN